MDAAQARAEADRLRAEHPDRERFDWLASEREGEWMVVKVPRRPGATNPPLRETTEAAERPPQAEDPRAPVSRDLGQPYG